MTYNKFIFDSEVIMMKDFTNFDVKFAFTLAEVLITLGIIGVVAALTIPGLINNYKAHRLHSQFLKSYSTVQQVFKQMEADDVSLSPKDYETGKFYQTFMRYLQAPFDCGTRKGSTQAAKQILPCYPFNDVTKTYKSLDGKATVQVNWFDDGQIAMQDGTLILFENYAEINQLWVSVDLNGFNNKPNRWGYDLFTFEFMDGELRTMGDKETKYNDSNRYCNPKATGSMNGIACAHEAKTHSDYFKKIIKEFK